MPDYGLKIKKDGIAKDVQDCTPKELAFSSSYACAKIIQTRKYEFTINTGNTDTLNFAFDAVLDLPLVILVFLWDPGDSSYKALGSENVLDYTQNYRGSYWFTEDTLYVQVENYTGSNIDTHIIYFVCYA